MIQLTRLNGIPIVLNSDLIKTAEASPDTMLTLVNGEKIIVRESCSEVTERVPGVCLRMKRCAAWSRWPASMSPRRLCLRQPASAAATAACESPFDTS